MRDKLELSHFFLLLSQITCENSRQGLSESNRVNTSLQLSYPVVIWNSTSDNGRNPNIVSYNRLQQQQQPASQLHNPCHILIPSLRSSRIIQILIIILSSHCWLILYLSQARPHQQARPVYTVSFQLHSFSAVSILSLSSKFHFISRLTCSYIAGKLMPHLPEITVVLCYFFFSILTVFLRATNYDSEKHFLVSR